jgi:two-component system chemotaxis response regulator CheB
VRRARRGFLLSKARGLNVAKVRVLVVDDSAFARKVMREVLSGDPEIEVVGIARDGLDALEKISQLAPDVITLDLLMPNLDGLGVLDALGPAGAPRVVVVSTAEQDGDLAVRALQAGAVELVHKPTSLATERLYELSVELVTKVKIAARARPDAHRRGTPSEPADRPTREATRARIVVIGASTGGPQALTQILSALPRDFPVPLAIVLHMPVGYTAALAARLDVISALDVVEASDGLLLRPGLAIVGRAGLHMRIAREGDVERVRLDMAPLQSLHRPAVDVLFESAAAAYGAEAMGLVLTGMGEDGLQGSRALVAAGSKVMTQTESSCVVYGMPRAVAEAGLSARSVSIDAVAATLTDSFRG